MRRTSAVASSLNLYFHRPYSRICSSGTGDLTVAEAFRATLPLSSRAVPSRSTAPRELVKERGREWERDPVASLRASEQPPTPRTRTLFCHHLSPPFSAKRQILVVLLRTGTARRHEHISLKYDVPGSINAVTIPTSCNWC